MILVLILCLGGEVTELACWSMGGLCLLCLPDVPVGKLVDMFGYPLLTEAPPKGPLLVSLTIPELGSSQGRLGLISGFPSVSCWLGSREASKKESLRLE